MEGMAYVVTAGRYDDYHICGIFTSKALAEDFIAAFGEGYDEPFIEEWLINPHGNEETGRRVYRVTLAEEDVEVELCCYCSTTSTKPFEDARGRVARYILARDEEEAVRLAKEL